MAVITIKPKDVVVPFDLTVLIKRKLDPEELVKFNKALLKKQQEEKEDDSSHS